MPAKIIIIEGPRGAGKSAVAQALRSSVWGSTLVNLTGFTLDGEEGLSKISYYYRAWMELLNNMHGDYTLIFDRTFFSEMVYSTLYKNYDFTSRYHELCEELMTTIEKIGDLYLYYFTVDDNEVLKKRLNRDKVQLFDDVPENVMQSNLQRFEYDRVMLTFALRFKNRPGFHYQHLNTADKSVNEVRDIVLESIK